MRKSIATVSVSGALPDKLEAISAAKFAGVEIFDQDLVSSPLSPEEIAARCADLGLRIEMLQPFRDGDGWDPGEFDSVARRFEAKLRVMERLGTSSVLVCSSVQPEAIDDVDLTAEQLHRLGGLAAEHGCTLGFEALAWGTHINRVGQAWEAVRRADHPAVRLTVDTFHLLARGDTAEALHGIPGGRIEILQIADAPHLSMDVLEWSRHHRCFPGQGTFDVAGVVGAVVESGYRGPLSLEVFSDIVREADPRETALDAMRSLLFLEEQLRERWQDEQGSMTLRPRVELFDPPPVPVTEGVGFAEIALAPDDTGTLGLLRSLGFAQRGRHRTKPVEWWANGEASLIVNTRTDDVARQRRHLPSVTSLGVVAEPVSEAADRASALLWPQVPSSRGAGEAPLPGLRTPSGVEVFLAGTQGAEDDWRVDFEQSSSQAPDATGWGPLDHVGIAVDRDDSDAEVSFFRTMLGLQPGPVSEFFDPTGRLRSRALTAPGSPLRVILNIAVRGPGRQVEDGVNQLAFGCADVIGATERLRASGAPLLSVPDNYYDDLDARFQLAPELLATLRRLGILYDRDATGGELLHVYTPLLGDGFYIELLERRGGYAGYGAANTPVRLAAQAAPQP
ncbi:bifunctional sugar phosphate isomerase/epimerase/4-hydroxyphenylpyruvate dioxygenase family protein [Actinomycetota bacterium]